MNRALLLGLAMLLLGGAVWYFAAGPATRSRAGGGERARMPGLGSGFGAPAPAVAAIPTNPRSPVQLEPLRTSRDVPASSARSDSAAPLTAPPRGTLRVLGHVRVDDAPLPSADATVRVYAGEPEEVRSRLLGSAAVHAGVFHLDVAADELARMGRRGAPVGSVTCVLTAPGFEVARDQVDVSDAVGDVLRVQLETTKCGLLVVGRIVSARGEPVPLAEVVVVELGPLGRDVEIHELQSGPDGCFQFALARQGFVDAVGRHGSHGVVRVAARSEAGSALLDLGDLRLESRGVVSGRLVGCGRMPLGRHAIELCPASEDGGFPGHETYTDDDGRFCFACLDATAYRVWIAGVDDQSYEELPVVTPDVLDLELSVPVPSARVTVAGTDGAPVSDIGLTVRPLQRVGDAWRIGGPGDSEVREAEAQPGVFHVTFSRPGAYSIGAATTVDGVRWTAHERLEIGLEHRALRLDLSAEVRMSLALEVTDPAGAPLLDWQVSFVDPTTGIGGGSRGARSPEVALAPGAWTASVEPRGSTYVMPFQVEVNVTEGLDRLTMRAPELGGRLSVRASLSGSKRSSVVATLERAGGGFSHALRLEDGEDLTTPPIPAGDYELTVPGARVRGRLGDVATVGQGRVPALTRAVSIRAGETTWLQLSVP